MVFFFHKPPLAYQDGSRISRKGVHIHKGVGGPFADFHLFPKYPMKMK